MHSGISGQPPRQDLVLVGGGHAHVLALRTLAMKPVPGLRITLISPAAFTPYSGMLPGLLAGHYSFEETHIDLARFCQRAGVRFLTDEVVALDPQTRTLRCRERGDVHYDLLSIDIGSQPELDSVPGARQHSVPVKPVAGLWRRWESLTEAAAEFGRIAVVGGGAGSVEIALAIAWQLRERPVEVALYSGSSQLLPGYGRGVRRSVLAQCETLGVEVFCDHRVSRVEADTLHFEQGQSADFNTLFWCTGASASPWIADSGLPVDARGFMNVLDTLQSTAYPEVFGAGDIAAQVNHPRPKAGVYAVRQAPVLAANLRAASLGAPLREHHPQTRFLSLLSLGPQLAAAERNVFSAHGRWVWHWKNHIDRKFMGLFLDLPARRMGAEATDLPEDTQAPCGGCGAKVGGVELRAALARLRERYPQHSPQQGSQLDPRLGLDDTALIDAGQALLQSTDQLRALIDDPWLMGRIAAQHALSDAYASGARPHSALAQLSLPFADQKLQERDLAAVLDGALVTLSAADCPLVGGHTMQGPELQLGFTINAVLDGQQALSKRGARVGDALILGKALGVGALFAAHMQQRADGRDIDAALRAMLQSNAEAAAIARRFDAHALTDISGFGLAGHLLEMLDGRLGARIELKALPALAGAETAMAQGVFSTLHESNQRLAALPTDGSTVRQQLLFDPQTSGGLLMAVPAAAADAALGALKNAGYAAAIIGEVLDTPASSAQALQLV